MAQRRRHIRVNLLTLVLVACPLITRAATSPAQVRCLDVLARQGAQLTVAAGRVTLQCTRATARARRNRVDTMPTPHACFAHALATRLAARVRRLDHADAHWCRATPPELGYTGATTVVATARGGPIALLDTVFGTDLAAITATTAHNRASANCQLAVASAALDLHGALWHATVGLSGLHDRLLPALEDPANPEVAAAIARVAGTVERGCAAAPAPLTALFALPCKDLATPTDLARCAVRVTRAQFYRGLAVTSGFAIACDLMDDGTRDHSCVPPEVAAHVLNRLGYGPDPFTTERLQALGVPGYVQAQLHPDTIPDDLVDGLLQQYPSLTMSFLQLRVQYPNRVVPGQPQSGDVLKELQRAKVLRAIASHRQLEQVLVDFWFNHFNIVATDRRDYDVSPYERIAIRPHVLGRFRDLLLAVARSPAMGDYLDARRNRAGALNENYARELMELHTVGVESGFTEADVGAVARAFTGWKEDQSAPDGFEFIPAFHDRGPKTVLGTTLPADGGYADGVAVLDLLAAHPSTAKRIARKLVVRFVSEKPPPALVDAATTTYLTTDGDLRAVMETILLSPEFLDDAANRRAKVKRPLHLLASAARATGADPTQLNLDRIRRRIRELGEDLYGFPAPSGYPDVSAFWTSPGTMLLRFNVLELAARGGDGIVPVFPASGETSEAIVDGLTTRMLPGGVSDATRNGAVALVDLLTDPNRSTRAATAAAVLLSSPEFLVH